MPERVCCVASGSIMAVYGWSRGSWLGYASAVAGGALVWRGLSGWCQIYQALGINTAEQPAQQPVQSSSFPASTIHDYVQYKHEYDQHKIDAASDDSFPASDPPSHNASIV